jgi:ribosomal peptide maturation radical SAM protein 1
VLRTLLVDLPFMSVHRPNLALTLLQGALRQAGYPCDLRYAKLDFAREIGVELYRVISEQLPHELLIGDYIFGEVLAQGSGSDFVASAREHAHSKDRVPEALWRLVPEIRRRGTGFLTELADDIARTGYDLIGLNLTFQISPGVSLAKLLKERSPRLRVVIGGGNCEGEMGMVLHRSFPWIDFVSRGEGEKLIVDLAGALDSQESTASSASPFRVLGHDAGIAGIQGLIWRAGTESVANGTRSSNVDPLDSLPEPDYTDYFEQLGRLGDGLSRSDLSVPFEASRGCWFGAKMHCTFCGLNGPSLQFRSKSPGRMLRELRAITRYGVPNADAVDLILDMKYFDTLLPALAKEQLDLAIFYELKSNINKAQVWKLKAAGVSSVQPGIESLSSSVLALMRKGVSAFQNVRLLKWLAEAGISVQWNILYGFPMEDPTEYERMAALVPYLVHLQPPAGGCMRVLLNRFSPLFFDAEALGVRRITPVSGYQQIFGGWSAEPERLAYYFNFEPVGGPFDFGYVNSLREAVKRWHQLYGKVAFTMVDRSGELHLYDTRPQAPVGSATLSGDERMLYLACDEGAGLAALCRTTGIERAAAGEILERFVELGWMICLDGRYVSLAVSMDDSLPEQVPPSLWQAVSTVKYQQMANFFVAQDQRANYVPERLGLPQIKPN